MTEALAYTASELAGLIRVSTSHVYRMARDGQVPCITLGGRVVFPKAAVHRWLDGQQVAS